jgi:hypothetical protein
LNHAEIYIYGGLAFVPDVIIAERAANGDTIPLTSVLRRGDGRTVHLYRAPAGAL